MEPRPISVPTVSVPPRPCSLPPRVPPPRAVPMLPAIPDGFTLRDWFAGMVLAKIAANNPSPDRDARLAYQYADAMIKARG